MCTFFFFIFNVGFSTSRTYCFRDENDFFVFEISPPEFHFFFNRFRAPSERRVGFATIRGFFFVYEQIFRPKVSPRPKKKPLFTIAELISNVTVPRVRGTYFKNRLVFLLELYRTKNT